MLRRMCPGHFERIHAESERGEEVALRESACTLEGYRKEGRTRGVCRDHKGLYGEGHSMELGLQFGKVTCRVVGRSVAEAGVCIRESQACMNSYSSVGLRR